MVDYRILASRDEKNYRFYLGHSVVKDNNWIESVEILLILCKEELWFVNRTYSCKKKKMKQINL